MNDPIAYLDLVSRWVSACPSSAWNLLPPDLRELLTSRRHNVRVPDLHLNEWHRKFTVYSEAYDSMYVEEVAATSAEDAARKAAELNGFGGTYWVHEGDAHQVEIVQQKAYEVKRDA